MPVKNKGSTIVVERVPAGRKASAGAASASQEVPDHRQDTKELLRQIRIRGDSLSAEIKELLVRMG